MDFQQHQRIFDLETKMEKIKTAVTSKRDSNHLRSKKDNALEGAKVMNKTRLRSQLYYTRKHQQVEN
jgi:hypothetical protein